MHILFLCSQMPYPPQSGGALRVYGLIDCLYRAGHTIDLLAFGTPIEGTPLNERCRQIIAVPPPPLRSKAARLRDLIFLRTPDTVLRFTTMAFHQALVSLLLRHEYTVIHMESIEMTTYLYSVRRVTDTARIYDSFNAEYKLQRTMADRDRRNPRRWLAALYSAIQYKRLMRFEREVCEHVNAVIAVSDVDAQAFRELAPDAQVFVVPNGIDVATYREPLADQRDLGEASILFTGSLDYRPNIDAVEWFAGAVFPHIRAQIPAARFVVVGRKPHPRLLALAADGQDHGITIIADVPDIRPYYAATTVFVAPLRMGSGTRLKLLEAMASGCAIVATTMGAAGLEVASGREMCISDTDSAFAEAVITLLRDPAQRQRLGAAGRQFVQAHYDWSALSARLMQVYRQLGLGELG